MIFWYRSEINQSINALHEKGMEVETIYAKEIWDLQNR